MDIQDSAGPFFRKRAGQDAQKTGEDDHVDLFLPQKLHQIFLKTLLADPLSGNAGISGPFQSKGVFSV